MDLTLDQLLASLQSDLVKSAEDEGKEEDKSEDKGEKKMPPWLKDKKDEKSESKSEDKDEKSEDKDEKEDKGQEKSASEAGAALAREIMEKAASINLETPEMNKQAQTAGQALASALLANLQKSAAEKKASAGDMTVMDGSAAPGTVPNKVQMDVVQTVAEGEAAIKPMVTGDGIKNTGTINEIFDALVADALSQGAASEQQVHETGVSAQEGAVEDHAVPNQVKVASEQDAIEKAAAITELVAQGVDFSDAVELVKQAAVEIEFEMEKAAAMTQLMAEGIDFDQAIELVKEASAGDMTVMDGGPVEGAAGTKVQHDAAQAMAEGAAAIKPMVTGDGVRNSGTINQIYDAIVADAKGQGAASVEQVHDTGVAAQEGAVEDHAVPNQVKVAAIERMVAAGVDFDEAVSIVKEAGMAAAVKAGAAKIKPMAASAKLQASRMIGRDVPVGGSKMTAAKALMKNPLVVGGAAAAGAGIAGGAMLAREKKAAFDALIDAGVDFDQAAILVSQKAAELYGK